MIEHSSRPEPDMTVTKLSEKNAHGNSNMINVTSAAFMTTRVVSRLVHFKHVRQDHVKLFEEFSDPGPKVRLGLQIVRPERIRVYNILGTVKSEPRVAVKIQER